MEYFYESISVKNSSQEYEASGLEEMCGMRVPVRV